ncbi:MAG: S41 family peptidase [Spirochaetia bacterium]|jgi:carboxyl-terminal processing protease|nr:S41 family peptidase [Spirochaetia bacterium]
MFKKIKERPVHFLFLSFAVGLILGINMSFVSSAEEPAHKYLDYFHQVYQTLRGEYVEEVDTKKLFYGAIQGMIAALDDPFSRFLDEKAYDELKEVTTGRFVGVGIEITVQDGNIIVISPIDDSPAMKAGIISGDIITTVDGSEIKGKNLPDIVNMIKGKPKSKVALRVKREGFAEPIDFELERLPIKIRNVDYSMISGTDIGYLKIKNFDSKTAQDTSDAIKSLKKEGAAKYIVDLRYNPGGLLTSAVELSGLFIDKGKVIVSTRGRAGVENERVFTSENQPLSTDELIVLVNKGSASASEIFAGAIHDNKRGKLLGEKTFGKGSVQKTYQLDENIGIAVTIAKYYTPSGEMIHKKGIMPDYVIEQEKITPKDLEAIKNINTNKLMDKFAGTAKEYNDDAKKAFYEYLKNNNIDISQRTADSLLKERLLIYKKRPAYDLEFDRQLAGAVDILKKQVKQ